MTKEQLRKTDALIRALDRLGLETVVITRPQTGNGKRVFLRHLSAPISVLAMCSQAMKQQMAKYDLFHYKDEL